MKYIFFALTLIASLMLFDYLFLELLFFLIDVLKNYFWVVLIVLFLRVTKIAGFFIYLAALPVILASLIIGNAKSKKIGIALLILNFIYVMYNLFQSDIKTGISIFIAIAFGTVSWSLIHRELVYLKIHEN